MPSSLSSAVDDDVILQHSRFNISQSSSSSSTAEHNRYHNLHSSSAVEEEDDCGMLELAVEPMMDGGCDNDEDALLHRR